MSKSEMITTQATYMVLVALEYIGVIFLIGVIPFAAAYVIPSITVWIMIAYPVIVVPLIIIVLAKTLFKRQKKYFESKVKVNNQKTIFKLNFIMRLWKEFLWAMIISFVYFAFINTFDCLDVCKNTYTSLNDFILMFRVVFTILLGIYLVQIVSVKIKKQW